MSRNSLYSSPYIDVDSEMQREASRELRISALTETGQAESSIKVPKQRAYSGRKAVIPSLLANAPCATLGVQGILEQLNITLGTSYTASPYLRSLLNHCILKQYDFGTVYGCLRPQWCDGLNAIEDSLRTGKQKDQEMRRNALVGNQIVATRIPPRRVWDLYSNRVVPWWVTKEQWPRPISHAWEKEKDRVDVWTPINGCEWPVPIPKDADLNLIRIEMLNLGIEYTWLDVLCLRQKGEKGEDLRVEEWKVDVPTIGYLYRAADVVVWYLRGLGRPVDLKADDWESEHWWFNRAWTLQEVGEDRIIAGDTPDGPLHAELIDEEGNYKEEIVTKFRNQLQTVDHLSSNLYNIFALLAEMQMRISTNPVDKIAGLAFCLESATIPAYYEDQPLEDAWTALVNTIIPWFRGDLFFGFPGPGNANKKWRPSWKQVMAMPQQEGECGGWVSREEETGNDWCEAYCIKKGTVRGLAERGVEGADRRGELTVEDAHRKTHAFQIIAAHEHPIPPGTYTLIGAHFKYWVVGVKLPNNWFEKVSVLTMPDLEERKRLENLNVSTKACNYLI